VTPYDDAFFRDRSASRRSADVVVPLVLELTSPASVVDVGCGTGSWLASFRANGVEDVLGIDGDYVPRAQLEIPSELFEAHDLTQPFILDRRFDLVLSLEVGEHLPESSARGFVESLVALSDLVLFSAAVPEQYGEHHVNEQWQDWWARLFEVYGYVAVDAVREHIWDDERVSWWYAQNTLLYVSEKELARRPALHREHDAARALPLRIVHPARMEMWPRRSLLKRVLGRLR
jgi:SAM-dependent methyltransferase